jgi:hypothetical protein
MEPCDDDAMCVLGHVCHLGNCLPKTGGEACSVDADCGQETYCTSTVFTPDEYTCWPRQLPLQPCGEWAAITSDKGCVWGFHCDHAARRCEPLVMPLCPGGCPQGSKCGTALQGGRCRTGE